MKVPTSVLFALLFVIFTPSVSAVDVESDGGCQYVDDEKIKMSKISYWYNQYRGVYDDRFLDEIIVYATKKVAYNDCLYKENQFWWGIWDKVQQDKKPYKLIDAVRIDRNPDLWISTDGTKYTRTDHGSWTRIPEEATKSCTFSDIMQSLCSHATVNDAPKGCNNAKSILKRSSCEFGILIQYEQKKALTHLKTNYPELFVPNFAEINNTFAYDIPRLPYTDCNGNLVSQKILGCENILALKHEAEKAEKLWSSANITNFKSWVAE